MKLTIGKLAQQAGFTLKKILELLSLDNEHCEEVQKIAEQNLLQINQQLNDLTALRNALNKLVKGCQQAPSTQHCR